MTVLNYVAFSLVFLIFVMFAILMSGSVPL